MPMKDEELARGELPGSLEGQDLRVLHNEVRSHVLCACGEPLRYESPVNGQHDGVWRCADRSHASVILAPIEPSWTGIGYDTCTICAVMRPCHAHPDDLGWAYFPPRVKIVRAKMKPLPSGEDWD